MPARLSRRSIAAYYADRVLSGNKTAVKQLAAYLVETRRIKELTLIIRDVEDELTRRGVLVADIESAYELEAEAKHHINEFLAKRYDGHVVLRTVVQPELIGGVRIRTPDAELDTTIRRKLKNLQATKI